MVKRLWVVAVLLLIGGAVFADAPEATEKEEAPASAPAVEEASGAGESDNENNGNVHNLVRGFANIFTGFLEVPRGMVYRNSQMPLWGLVSGAVEGVGLTAIRAASGVTDIIFLGFDYGLWFNDSTFREYVWESDWLPPEDKR